MLHPSVLRQFFLRRNNRRPSTPLERPQQWQRCKVHGCSTTGKNGLDRRASRSFICASTRNPNQEMEPRQESSFGWGFPSTPRIARRSGQAPSSTSTIYLCSARNFGIPSKFAQIAALRSNSTRGIEDTIPTPRSCRRSPPCTRPSIPGRGAHDPSHLAAHRSQSTSFVVMPSQLPPA